ncbi:hypothetical protein GY45DRAFT_861817 [Cubamyces sp. BRFM 1775]|nr:hypothetical protein GY45DRAFT_861817 [Cubamyces sp. BRFM 1775]
MSTRRSADSLIAEILACVSPDIRQICKDYLLDELEKKAKQLRDQLYGVDNLHDWQLSLWHWVKDPKCLSDKWVAEARPTVYSEEGLMDPAKSVMQLSIEAERQRVARLLNDSPKPASSDDDPYYATFTPLPATVRTARQPYVFGWPITKEWLVMFSTISGKRTESDELSNGLTQLSYRAGCRIFYTLVVHPDAPEWAGDDRPSDVPEFPILRVCDTLYWDEYLLRRPTEAQYEWLKHVLPGEPGWFRLPLTFENFDEVLRISGRPYYICDPFP